MPDVRSPPTQIDYYALVQQAYRDRHRRSTLGPGMCQQCGRPLATCAYRSRLIAQIRRLRKELGHVPRG